jgi:hypothetical protein
LVVPAPCDALTDALIKLLQCILSIIISILYILYTHLHWACAPACLKLFSLEQRMSIFVGLQYTTLPTLGVSEFGKQVNIEAEAAAAEQKLQNWWMAGRYIYNYYS